MKITVFGGSSPKPGEETYQQAYDLGRQLAGNGYSVATGGYMGTMEAVSRGANEAGGHVIGITCADLERYRPTKANQWVIEEIRHETLHQRLGALIDICDAAIALPGGIGTLAEIVVMWNQLLTGSQPPKPLILIGEGWKSVVEAFFQSQGGYFPEKDKQWILFAENVDEGINKLMGWKAPVIL